MEQDATVQSFDSSSSGYLLEELEDKKVLLDKVLLEKEGLKKKYNQLELSLEKKEQKISHYAEKLSEYKAALQGRDDVVSLLQQNLSSSLTQLEQHRAGTGSTALQLQEEVEGLSQQLQQALQLLAERDDQGSSWRLQHFQLQQQVEKLTRENEDACLKLLHTEKTLLTLRDAQKNDENKCSEARKQLQTVTYEWSAKEKSFSEKSKKLEARIVLLEQNLDAEKHAKEEVCEQLDEARKERQVAESAAQKLLQDRQEEVIALTNKCQQLQASIVNLESKNLAYHNELMELRTSFSSCTKELKRSQSEVLDFTVKTEGYSKEIEMLKTSIVNLNQNIVKKDEVQCDLVARNKSYEEEFIALNNQIIEFTNEIQENDGKYEELIMKCKGLEEELSNCQSNISELNKELLSKENEKHSMSIEMKKLITENENMCSQLLSLEQDMQNVHKQVSGLEAQRDELREREQQLVEDLDRLGGEAARSEAARQELDSCLRDRDGQVTALRGEKEELTRQLSEHTHRIETLQHENGQLGALKHEQTKLLAIERENKDVNNRRLLEQAAKIASITEENERLKHSVKELEVARHTWEQSSVIPSAACREAGQELAQQRPSDGGAARDGWPQRDRDADQATQEELNDQVQQLRIKVSNLNFVIKSLENENSNLKRHKKANKVLNESVNETIQRNAELLAELENMTLKYKQAEIRLKALDTEVELLNKCVNELQKLNSSCEMDAGGDRSEAEGGRLSQELALNITQQRLQEHEQIVLLMKSSHEQSRTAQLTLRDELREAVYTNMSLHAESLAAHELCRRLARTNTCYRDLLTTALDGLWTPEQEQRGTEAAFAGTEQSAHGQWREAVAAALARADGAVDDGNSEADAILYGQHRIERLFEECTAADSTAVDAVALQGIQWAYHVLLRAALLRCGVQWPLDGPLQAAVSEALQGRHHEQDCLRYAGLCRALCAPQQEDEEEDGAGEDQHLPRGQLRELQRAVQGSVARGVAVLEETVRGLLQVVDGSVEPELGGSSRTEGPGQGGRLVLESATAADTASPPLPAAQPSTNTHHDTLDQPNTLPRPSTLDQPSTLAKSVSPVQTDHLQNLLGDREVHQTVIVQLTEACAQLLHYYSVSEACTRGRSAAAAAPSPDTSHDASNIDGFIDDTLWSSGSVQPRSLDAVTDPKLSSIVALVERYEQQRPPQAADHAAVRARLWDTASLHDDVEERRVRDGLIASYPHMMACLSGQWESVDLQGLDKDVQEMTISLQASAGMLKVMHHSKQFANVEPSESVITIDGAEGSGSVEEQSRDVVFEVAGDGCVFDQGKDLVTSYERGTAEQPLLRNKPRDIGISPPDTDTVTGAKHTETDITGMSAHGIDTTEEKDFNVNTDSLTKANSDISKGSENVPDSVVSGKIEGHPNRSPSKNESIVVCQSSASDEQLAQDADTTRLKPAKAALGDQQTEEEKLLKLTAEVQEVKSENHRLHGLCLGLQTEKNKLQEELESLEKYSSFITRELQTVQQTEGSEAPRSSDSEEYSNSGTEQGAASPLAQHARSLLLQRGQSSNAARVGELEAVLEALLREQHEQRKALAAQAQDLTTQLECADRQLRASRQFVEELTHEREAEVEQFVASNAQLTEQVREHAAAAEHTARLATEVEALEGELLRQTRRVEALTAEAATAREALKEAHSKIQELCAVLSNRDDAEAVSAAREGEAQDQITALREQLTHAHQQLHQQQELQAAPGEGGPPSPRRSPCPHCSGAAKRPAATVESPRQAAPRRYSLKEEMLQQDAPSTACPPDQTLAEDINTSTICKVEQRVMRLTKNLEAVQFAGQQDASDQRSGDVDDGVSSDEEQWGGYGGGGGDDSSLRCLSPSALDRRLEERLLAMERVTQAAVKHTADLEMTLALTRANLQEVMDDKDAAQQHLDEVTQKMGVLQKQYSSDRALLEAMQSHNNELQSQCQSERDTVRSLQQDLESRSNECKTLSKERETLLQKLAGFEEEVIKLLGKVGAFEVAGAEAARNEEAKEKLAEEADQNTKAEMGNILQQLDVKTRQLESSNKQLDEKSKEFQNQSQELAGKCSELQAVVQQLEDAKQELRTTRDALVASQREAEERSLELEEVRREREYLQGSLSEQLVKVAGLQARLEEQKRAAQCGPSVAETEARLLALRTALDRATNDITLKDRQLSDLKYNLSTQRSVLVQREEELERLLQRPRPASPPRTHSATQTEPGAEAAALASAKLRLEELNMKLEAKTRHLQDVMAEDGDTSDPEVLRRASVASSVMLHPHWSAAKSACSSDGSSVLSSTSTPRPHSPRLALDSPPQMETVTRKALQQQTEDEFLQQSHEQEQRRLEDRITLLQQREEEQQREHGRLQTSYEQLKQELKTALEEHGVRVGALEKSCAESAASLAELRVRSSGLQDSLQTSQQSVHRLNADNKKLQKELANSAERLDAVTKELARVTQRLSDVRQQNENSKQIIEEQNKQLEERASGLTDANTELQTMRQQLQQEQDRGKLVQQELDHMEQERDQAKQERDHMEQERDHMQQERDHVQQERDHVQQEMYNSRQVLQGKTELVAAARPLQEAGQERLQKGAPQPASAEAREVSALQERVDRRAASLQQLERRLGAADSSVRTLEQQLQDRQARVEQLTAQLAASDEHRQQLQEALQVKRSQLSQLDQRGHGASDRPLDASAARSEVYRHSPSTSPSPAREDISTGLGLSTLSSGDCTLDVTNLTPAEASKMAARLADRVQREGVQVLELTEFLFLKGATSPQLQLGAAASLQQQQHRVSALEQCVRLQRELSQCRQDGQEVQALEDRLQHERLTRLSLEGQLSAATARNGRLELQQRDLTASLDQLRCIQEETEGQLERAKCDLSEERSNFLQVSDKLQRATQLSSAQHRRHLAATEELKRCLQEERRSKAALVEEVSELRAQLGAPRLHDASSDRLSATHSHVPPPHAECEELQRLACDPSAGSTERRLWRAAEASLVAHQGADDRRQALLAHRQLTETVDRLAQEKEMLLLQKGRAEQRCRELEQQHEELQQQYGRLEQTLCRQMALQAESAVQTTHPRLSPPPSAPLLSALKEELQALQQRNADLQHDRAFYQEQCSRLQQELSQRPAAPPLGCPATAQLLPVATTEELQQRLQHTFARYLRAQSHKKALVWQKTYLLKALSQDPDASPCLRALLHPTMIDGAPTRLSQAPPLVRFRSVCHVVRAVWRLQQRVRHMAATSRIPGAVSRPAPRLSALDAEGAELRDSMSCTSLEVCGYTAGVATHGLALPPALVSPVAAPLPASPHPPRHTIQRPTATYLGRPAPSLPHRPRPGEAPVTDGLQHWTLQSPPTRDQPLNGSRGRSSQVSRKEDRQDYVGRAEALHDTLGLLPRPGH